MLNECWTKMAYDFAQIIKKLLVFEAKFKFFEIINSRTIIFCSCNVFREILSGLTSCLLQGVRR